MTAPRTIAATEARRRARTHRLASELGDRLGQLDDAWLCALARAVMAEVAWREHSQESLARPIDT